MGRRLVDERIGDKRFTPICPRHKLYRGYRSPRTGCEICWDVRAFMIKYGVREEKNYPKKGRAGRYWPRKPKPEAIDGIATAPQHSGGDQPGTDSSPTP